MKKITFLLLFCLTVNYWSFSQCTNQVYQYPPTTITLTALPGQQQIAPDNWPQNEFSVIDGLVIGESYTITATPDVTDPDYTPGAMTYITVTTDGTTIIVDGFDTVSFVASTTGITVYWTLDAACADGPNLNTLTQIECTTCTCTATAAPVLENPTPSDGNMMVPIIPDGADLLITPFEWEDNGDPSDSYTLSLGVTPAGNDIGTLNPATNGNGILYTWAENTTYYWFVTGTNCQGTTTSPVWSFTTAACNETTAPACGNLLLPADNEPAYTTSEAENGTREVNLSWEMVPGALAYNITFDGNDLGSIADTDIDIFGLDYNTQYTWSISPINCFGQATGCATRTFTTEEENLSIDEFDANALSVYPNPVKDVLNVKTDLTLESIEVFNILGKNVLTVSGNQISDNSINLSALRNGVYFVNILAEGKKQTIKVVKQ